MAADLATDPDLAVTLADRDERALAAHDHLDTVTADLADPTELARVMEGHDLVISALPGFLGHRTLQVIIQEGRNVVDIAFSPEDPFTLDDLAVENGVVAVVDCGVSPGMSGLLVGHAASLLDEVQDVLVYVGGLPEQRERPWEYKAVFSPIDVIAEYTRPARLVEDGRIISRPALSDLEVLEFEGIGELEAFNTDGLRTLLRTIDASSMREKTLRYPGHAGRIEALRDSGFFGEEAVDIGGLEVRPLDLASRLLFPMWQLDEGEEDLTVMQVKVTGRQDGSQVRYVFDLLDRYDSEKGVTSMARTTGYTATAVARLILSGGYTRTGISPPEFLGKEQEHVEFVLAALRDRGVIYHQRVEPRP